MRRGWPASVAMGVVEEVLVEVEELKYVRMKISGLIFPFFFTD